MSISRGDDLPDVPAPTMKDVEVSGGPQHWRVEAQEFGANPAMMVEDSQRFMNAIRAQFPVIKSWRLLRVDYERAFDRDDLTLTCVARFSV